jgi:hypothetical protein
LINKAERINRKNVSSKTIKINPVIKKGLPLMPWFAAKNKIKKINTYKKRFLQCNKAFFKGSQMKKNKIKQIE